MAHPQGDIQLGGQIFGLLYLLLADDIHHSQLGVPHQLAHLFREIQHGEKGVFSPLGGADLRILLGGGGIEGDGHPVKPLRHIRHRVIAKDQGGQAVGVSADDKYRGSLARHGCS